MGFTSFLKDVGHVAAGAIHDTSSALNTVDRYINPFHVEQGSAHDPTKTNKSNFLGLGSTAPVANAVVNHVAMPSIEHVSSALNWVYDNGISQPISTAMMVGAGPQGIGGVFKGANWAQAWHAANHISPAQALFLNPDQTQKAINSPLEYYKPDSAYLPPGFDQLPKDQQQKILKDAGMPAIGNAYLNELKQSNRLFKYSSGLGDFALRWTADPMIMAGKVYAAGRAAKVTRPITATTDVAKLVDSSKMAKVQQWLWDNKDNPALTNNLAMAQKSAMGPRFGAILSQLQSPAEVRDFLLVGAGNEDALTRLVTANAQANFRIAQDTSRLDRLVGKVSDYESSPNLQALVQRHIDQLQDGINSDTALVQRYNQVIKQKGTLDAANVTRWSTQRAEDRTAAKIQYRANTARGGAFNNTRARSVTITPAGGAPQRTLTATLRGTPMENGLLKTRLYGLGDYFAAPITMVRSLSNMRPNGYMRIDDIDNDAMAELHGQLARIPGIKDSTRQAFLNQYLKTQTEADRLAILDQVGRLGAAKVAAKHGLSPELGEDLYQAHLKRQFGERDNQKRYTATKATVQLPSGEFARIHVDEFMDDNGKLVIHPNLVTRLANDHVFQDLDQMDKVLARHASALSAIRTSRLGNLDWVKDAADYTTSLFKFATLFRLGYIPRVLTDDLGGQSARLGSAAMAMRTGWGVSNLATNTAMWLNKPFHLMEANAAKEGMNYLDDELALLQGDMAPIQQEIKDFRDVTRREITTAGRRYAAAQKLVAKLPANADPAVVQRAVALQARSRANLSGAVRRMQTGKASATLKLRDMEIHHGWLTDQRALRQADYDNAMAKYTGEAKKIQGNQPVKVKAPRAKVAGLPIGARTGDTFTAPAAFAGPEGQMFQTLTSADEAIGNIFQTNKQIIHGHLMRSFDHGGKVISAAQDEALHAQSWAHAVNNQLYQDAMARQFVHGADVDDVVHWLTSTGEGRTYWQRLGLNMTTPEDEALRIKADVDQYMPTPEIRAKAQEPEGVSPQFLKDAVPMAERPDVHTGQVGHAQVRYRRALDRVMKRWFDVAGTLPANRLSRHPLFNQLYTGHLQQLRQIAEKQGALDTSVDGINSMASTARKLALRDTRKLVFDIAHRTDASAAMRFSMPFMTATNESFQRWGRIIADRPQTIGYANLLYNAPNSMAGVAPFGVHLNGMQDADGNQIDRNGYAWIINPKTGKAERTLVPKSQRYIVGRMPSWILKNSVGIALGVERSSGNFQLSQNSMNLVTQGDPWFSPGVGPIVQIPVNELVKDKPKAAELARQLDILPFGPQQGGPGGGNNPLGRAESFLLPSTVKNFLTRYDTSDERYQAVKAQIVQRAIFEHETMGKPMPSAQKIADMTKRYWFFAAASSFLQPMATQRKDAYQFYRDAYNALERKDPKTADQEFIHRYGESYFIFAESQSKNNTGVQATIPAVELEKKYGSLMAQFPELGALIVGPQGNGPFSPEAYSYQLNTPVTPGGSEMQRTKMSADEMLAENRRRLGWSQFSDAMSQITADLHAHGFQSFTDKGADQWDKEKKAVVMLLGSPTMPDGSANSFYNEQWSKDYSTLDTQKYERMIPALTKIASSNLASDPNRSDIRVLQQYLAQRAALVQVLQQRGQTKGGSATITAQSNADLLAAWQRLVDGMIESNTNFQDLHSRYLSRDLGYDGSLLEA